MCPALCLPVARVPLAIPGDSYGMRAWLSTGGNGGGGLSVKVFSVEL